MARSMIVCLIIWGTIAKYVPEALAIDIGSKISISQPMSVVNGSQSPDFSGKLVIFVFWSFKCPVALAYDDRINRLQEKYGNRGVVVFGVASAFNETQAEIRANAANLNLNVPVLVDTEGNLAEMFGATHTPSIFMFDENKVLRYKGALDNNKKAGESGRAAYVEEALDAILEGRPVAVPETRAFGCSIRRRVVKD